MNERLMRELRFNINRKIMAGKGAKGKQDQKIFQAAEDAQDSYLNQQQIKNEMDIVRMTIEQKHKIQSAQTLIQKRAHQDQIGPKKLEALNQEHELTLETKKLIKKLRPGLISITNRMNKIDEARRRNLDRADHAKKQQTTFQQFFTLAKFKPLEKLSQSKIEHFGTGSQKLEPFKRKASDS